MRLLTVVGIALALSACENASSPGNNTNTQAAEASRVEKHAMTDTRAHVDAILAQQPDTHKARYVYRHPAETLSFFGIKPGMTVVELLPGNGWYSQILVPLLGEEGTLIGADYNMDMWPNFDWVDEKFIASRVAWPEEWTAKFSSWGGEHVPDAHAATISTVDSKFDGKVDSVLFIRAMHNLSRFEDKGQFLSQALQQSYEWLKSGGTVGIVQHQAPEDKSDEWASGARGYLKTSAVKKAMQEAGFEFVAESNVNENPLDRPSDEDIVWRLPPAMFTSQNDEEMQKKYKAIGESNRMTLLFKKPDA